MSRRGARPKPAGGAVGRCGIYTRKSSEEGLEQNFHVAGAVHEFRTIFVGDGDAARPAGVQTNARRSFLAASNTFVILCHL